MTPIHTRSGLQRPTRVTSVSTGVAHWWKQPLPAAASLVLATWCAASFVGHGGGDESFGAWLRSPLVAVSAILLVVAWNMAELEHFRQLLRGPAGDRVVLLLTFVLTVLFDLTVAIQAGVVLAAFLFMHRMTEVVEIGRDP